MTDTDYLIVGQGISGTFLSFYLLKENKKVVVVDDGAPGSPSKIAAGVINPVTGRRMVTVWLADEIFPFVWKAYNEIGQQLGITAISQKTIIDFFPNPFMREGFLKKIESGDKYVHAYPEQNYFNNFFNYEFGCGEIKPAYTAHLETLLPAWMQFLQQSNLLLRETFDYSLLHHTSEGIHYKDIRAKAVLFCDGATGAGNPYFQQLPFAHNKGEALVLSIPDLPPHHIYKRGMLLVPMAAAGMFWIGSAYTWQFENADPTPAFRESTEALLKNWFRLPYKVEEHLAGLRPATLERRPFAGMHPLYPSAGILNGMGTKGCSLAPFFAQQLCNHLVYGQPIYPEASVARFQKILSR
ncbi:MAG TPA: FAD-dependent oxidoreductase [Chitinophagaceae bacterium]|nr:FAD-dependent oxidoreductase [Chitinophagaceae bacterium]